MAKQQTGRTEGFWLSVPIQRVYGQADPIICKLGKRYNVTRDWEIALDVGIEAFVAAGYEDDDTVFATLYQIGKNGGLVFSECFPIYGPAV